MHAFRIGQKVKYQGNFNGRDYIPAFGWEKIFNKVGQVTKVTETEVIVQFEGEDTTFWCNPATLVLVEEAKPEPSVVVFHHDDNDGYAAAMVVRLRYPNAVCVPVQYNDNTAYFDYPKTTNVFMVDFSLSREVITKLSEYYERFLLIDHHRSSCEQLAGLECCVLDMSVSGCELTWRTFFPDDPMPEMLSIIGDYDIFRWANADSGPINDGFSHVFNIKSVDAWTDAFKNWEEVRGKCLELGRESFLRTTDTAVRFANRATFCRYKDIPCAVINYSGKVSFLGATCMRDPAVKLFINFIVMADIVLFDLRSTDTGADAGRIAEANGGGGHRCAAGFRLPLAKGLELIAELYSTADKSHVFAFKNIYR